MGNCLIMQFMLLKCISCEIGLDILIGSLLRLKIIKTETRHTIPFKPEMEPHLTWDLHTAYLITVSAVYMGEMDSFYMWFNAVQLSCTQHICICF